MKSGASTRLADELEPSADADPSKFLRFFSEDDRQNLERNFRLPRETQPVGVPGRSCETNLFLGFFFDGTRNNYAQSELHGDHTHSNVARLFDAFPGQSLAPQAMLKPELAWPNEADYPNYFRVYTPGVGTRFDEVKDTGKGMDRTFGAAFALWGERRLVWSLGQAINAVHRYFTKSALLTASDLLKLNAAIELDRTQLKNPPHFMVMDSETGPQPVNTKARLEGVLKRLHAALKPHIPQPEGGRPEKVDPGIVKTIYVSAFGFSRGATAARAFANWFLALCEIDAKLLGRPGPTLCGIPVTFDFLGLFDTVASVGMASSTLAGDGHGAWADAEVSLRIPPGVKCLHLVSAHEVRRSFPLDSISVHGALSDGCQEVVFPGVHSDVGGGYAPKEQGRGEDPMGADLLSRIPLAVMYRQARLNGVPLKLELARAIAKDRFKIAPQTIEAFNAYIAASEAYAKQRPRTTGKALTQIMRTQMEMAMLWRKGMAGRMEESVTVQRALPEDRNDIVSADKEFVQEVKRFEIWRKDRAKPDLICSQDLILATCVEVENRRVPGLDSGRFDEWDDVARFWDAGPVPSAAKDLFENHVHDSRAWFKVTGTEAADVEAELKRWATEYKWLKNQGLAAFDQPTVQDRFTPEQQTWIEQYLATGRVPPMRTKGREPFELGAGYLRFRRVYAGGDKLLITFRVPERRFVRARVPERPHHVAGQMA